MQIEIEMEMEKKIQSPFLNQNLNSGQKEAVSTTEGPIMLLAGAGSGKTRTLVSRIGHLLNDKNIGPYRVLALTFSNKAAREMRDRIAHEVGVDLGALQVTTFHSFAARMLRQESSYLGLSKSFTIYDDSEQKSVVKNILGRHGISLKEISPYEVIYYIENLRNIGHYPDRKSQGDESEQNQNIDKKNTFYQYFLEYEQELHRANAIDFGGLITGLLQLFETFPEVLARYQERYCYILVDEYQDTNKAQFDLIKLLSGQHRNICVVGDEDQSIYSWRGADIRNILDFEKHFPDMKLIKLEQNYRSGGNIIRAAGHVIEKNNLRKGKTMWTDNPDGELIQIKECCDEKSEANYISSEIIELIKNKKINYSDVAVFYRTNSQSRVIEDAFRREKIPYRVVGGVRFYERKEIKDILAYMRLVVNPKDSLAYGRIINFPPRGIGATSLRKLEEEAISKGCSLLEIGEHLLKNQEQFEHIRLSSKVKSSLQEFQNLIFEIKILEDQKCSLFDIFEKILHESGYYNYLKAQKDYESEARIENLEELGNALKSFSHDYPEMRLMNFLETITLHSESESDRENNSGEVSLMTVHGAKGLEFPYVFISGAEENVFPSYKSIESGEVAVEEERRLFYVAMTRAMKKLHISFAQGRMLFGQIKFNGFSRFLLEMPKDLYRWDQWQRSSFGQEKREDEYSQLSPYDDDAPIVQRRPEVQKSSKSSLFYSGAKIRHELYGEGKILEHEGQGPDEKVVILFKGGTKKKFMVKFAPLTLL